MWVSGGECWKGKRVLVFIFWKIINVIVKYILGVDS